MPGSSEFTFHGLLSALCKRQTARSSPSIAITRLEIELGYTGPIWLTTVRYHSSVHRFPPAFPSPIELPLHKHKLAPLERNRGTNIHILPHRTNRRRTSRGPRQGASRAGRSSLQVDPDHRRPRHHLHSAGQPQGARPGRRHQEGEHLGRNQGARARHQSSFPFSPLLHPPSPYTI